MQITKVEVTPVDLKLRHPVLLAGLEPIKQVMAVFVRLDTRQGHTAWGCTAAHARLTGEKPDEVLRQCRETARLVPDLHPMQIEYNLGQIAARVHAGAAALCAFDLAFHDLLSQMASMPLYRLLGGYRDRIMTSVTVPLAPLKESVEFALSRADLGFRILKIKGGLDPDGDVARVQAIHRALPDHVLRLDADGGYSLQDALDVARALQGRLEMIEQPVPPGDTAALRQVKEISPIPVLADQSVRGPDTALDLAMHRAVDGLSVKLVGCGGLLPARQMDAVARAARLATMVGCFIEPALLISAGLAMALSSPNVRYGDLDGCLDLLHDPSQAGFTLQDGWLVASDVPGLGYTVDL